MMKRNVSDIKSQIATAMGDEAPDLIIIGGKVVNVITSEILSHDIAIKDDRIVRVGNCNDITEQAQKVIDATGSYLIPGLIDSHIHTESTLMTPANFTIAALPRGTTTIACDPHEIANVLGIKGLDLFIEEAIGLPIEFMVELSSCVPAAPTLENGPNEITGKEYQDLLDSGNYFALAEMMNFPGVIYRDDQVIEKLAAAEASDKVREGHAPGLRGKELQAYITAGITSDHESYLIEEVIEKIQSGMKIQLREGSFARNLVHLATGIKEKYGESGTAWDSVIICTDDKHADDILDEGHLDHALRLLVNKVGIDPITAIRVCTYNVANHLKRQDLGAIAPGRIANIVKVNNLSEFKVEDVISQGKHVASNHQLLTKIETKQNYPDWAMNTVNPKFLPSVDDLFISGPEGIVNGQVQANIIGVIEHSLITEHFIETVTITNGKIDLSDNPDLAYYFLLDRHDNTANFARSLVRGFNFQGKSAVASTVAHDSHQLLVTGNSAPAMSFAMNKLVESKGGQIIVEEINGEFNFQLLPLPYAGLMSILSPVEVGKIMKEMKNFSRKICPGISEPFMSLSFMALPVIPALKLTDMGLVDVNKFQVIDLFI